ncbi:hypothetical protein F5X97DRAFT_332238 [Nemania serpens]|nr:hypothetical protein F5X97DRAFT_332238 [Nemania serpens]
MEEFYVQNITNQAEYDPDGDITLFILHNGAWFHVHYVAKNLADSHAILEQHREDNAILCEKDGREGRSLEVAIRLRRPFEELMRRLAPGPLTESMKSLHSYLYPPSFILEAAVSEDHIQPRLKTPLSRQHFVRPGQYMGLIQPHLSSFASEVSVYSSRQAQVMAHTSSMVPSVVNVDSVTYFFKPWIRHRAYHELRSHGKILEASEETPALLQDAYICRLHGLVIDHSNDVLQHYHLDSDEEEVDDDDSPHGTLVGLLLTYIENKGTMEDLAPWTDCTNEERARWLEQIRSSVRCLHAAGVVWGDAKPLNVLIGKDGNAYLIDFGGSYTQGWVDKDKMETVEGDLQGVKKIEEWLLRWSERPVSRGMPEEELSASAASPDLI